MSELLKSEMRKLKRRQERNLRNAHAEGLLQGILSMLCPKDVVIDCGANVGKVTQALLATGAHVHAFEPDPFAFSQLQKAVETAPNVTLHNAAIGLESGSIKLMRAHDFDDNPHGHSVKSTVVTGGRKIDENQENMIDVAQISITEFLADVLSTRTEIAFLKMDIEGAELEILEHMLEKDLFAPIRLTVAETHEHKFKELRPRFARLREKISDAHPITKVNLDWI